MGAIVAIQPQHAEPTLGELGEAERLFLWLVRTWVQGLNQNIDVDHELAAELMAHRIPDAATTFDGLMMSVATCASRNIDIRCRRTLMISTDEIILLRAFSAMAAGLRPLAEAILHLMVDGTGRRIAADNLQHLSDRFASVALVPMPFRPVKHRGPKLASAQDSPKSDMDRRPSAGRLPDAS